MRRVAFAMLLPAALAACGGRERSSAGVEVPAATDEAVPQGSLPAPEAAPGSSVTGMPTAPPAAQALDTERRGVAGARHDDRRADGTSGGSRRRVAEDARKMDEGNGMPVVNDLIALGGAIDVTRADVDHMADGVERDRDGEPVAVDEQGFGGGQRQRHDELEGRAAAGGGIDGQAAA